MTFPTLARRRSLKASTLAIVAAAAAGWAGLAAAQAPSRDVRQGPPARPAELRPPARQAPKPGDPKPSDARPADPKPAEPKPAATPPERSKPDTPRPDTAKPEVPKAPAPGQSGGDGAASGRENPPAEGTCLTSLRTLFGDGVWKAEARPPAGAGDAFCQVTEPVQIQSLRLGEHTLAIEPAITLSCEMATRTAGWIAHGLRPLVRGTFERDLAALRVGGGHECRRRNRAAAGTISEHATARAIDIFGFVLAGEPKTVVSVEKPEDERQRRFLDAVRQSGCGAFTTSLGPGSDAAHANHLHFDIQARRSASTRFCQ